MEWIILWALNILVLYLVIVFAINNSHLRCLKGWLEQMNHTIEELQSDVRDIKKYLATGKNENDESEQVLRKSDLDPNAEEECPGCGILVPVKEIVCPHCELKLSD
ncbi:hypothetical protein [Desulfosporosinus nitroreducens]|uniref:Zinc ribbon domain-containing protein n=1 Tax=Desulfosporosinus nitroreducens TaxID=2018668 RepID=A0ABT8QXH2_9FIRM|nr:hypothetical protein [Desulfosporosinus nitroreducens]MDO0826047.1 hypothetical protein [Desulfosporosinus nitroreducens]